MPRSTVKNFLDFSTSSEREVDRENMEGICRHPDYKICQMQIQSPDYEGDNVNSILPVAPRWCQSFGHWTPAVKRGW